MRKVKYLVSIMLLLSILLSGCGGGSRNSSPVGRSNSYDYAEKARAALEEYNYTAAKEYLDQWMAVDPEATEDYEFRQVYDAIVQMYEELDIEPETGYEFKRNIDYMGKNLLIVSSDSFPAVVNATSTNGLVEVEFYVRMGETASVLLPADEYVITYTRGDIYDEWGPPDYFWHHKTEIWHEAVCLSVSYDYGYEYHDSALIELK